MRLSPTFSLYLARHILIGFAVAFVALVALLLVVDMVELSRRAAGAEDAGFGVVLELATLHIPYLSERVLPYAVLVGTMLALTRLSRSSELVVARSAGIATWQMLMPGVVFALAVGAITVAVLNPLAAATLSRYELLDGRYLRGEVSALAVASSGLWLRQADGDGEAVIHAQRISQEPLELHQVIIFRFAKGDRFQQRVDAHTARLEAGAWILEDAMVTAPNQPAERVASYAFPTDLTISRIQESFAAPETLSFWQIPAFVKVLERAGFSSLKHRLHWHAVLSTPLLLAGMVLLGATFSMRVARQGRAGLMIGLGVVVGFALYVFSDVIMALGLSSSIPPLLAAYGPAAVACLLGAGLLVSVRHA